MTAQPRPTLRPWLALLVTLSLVLAACAGGAAQAQVVQADIPRQIALGVPIQDVQALQQGNTAFALELYQALDQAGGNLFCSPYSISLALAMTYAGARSETEAQMARTLHFDLPQERLHPAFNALDLALNPAQANQPGKSTPFQLHTANSLWGQQDESFLNGFLDTLAANYGAGMHVLDYARDPEAARDTINRWVSEQTAKKIQDLIPEGELDAFTRLVLVNAIYFKADWLSTFDAVDTQPAPFTRLDGSPVQVPMMHQSGSFRYAQGQGYQALELPYYGGAASMIILLPEAGNFEQFESSLTPALLEQTLQSLQPAGVQVSLPRFQFESSFNLSDALASLGMPLAFTPPDGDSGADFSGMDGQRQLYIDNVFHKAFVAVDEKGTEAAAATAVEMGVTSAPMDEVQFNADRPFIFLIRHESSQSILFLGRVLDPQ